MLDRQPLSKTTSKQRLVVDMESETLPLLRYLEERGITLKDLIDVALELFVPHPGVETKEKAAEILREEFLDALSDVNVSCLEVACFRVEEDAKSGLVPGLTRERFMGRPGLVADELLGMTIANYIAGARGIFEFIRFDKAKPGILKKLGPISNDALGGLIAGVSSNMYTRALRSKR
jgi:alpha-ribazole phosphatase CobZ